jgi:hypothetical protein
MRKNPSVTYTEIVDGCKYVIMRTTNGVAMVHAGDCSNKIHSSIIVPSPSVFLSVDTISTSFIKIRK